MVKQTMTGLHERFSGGRKMAAVRKMIATV